MIWNIIIEISAIYAINDNDLVGNIPELSRYAAIPRFFQIDSFTCQCIFSYWESTRFNIADNFNSLWKILLIFQRIHLNAQGFYSFQEIREES